MTAFYTIGHSTHPIGDFIEILSAEKIAMVVDVRTIPRSRTNPQFNFDTLPTVLSKHEIEYVHLTELGGRRGRQADVQPSPNTFWDNVSFRNYADYALSNDFQAGLQRLEGLGAAERCVIMCAEAVWWRCHRRIITDYLLLNGATVNHIMGLGKMEAARPTSAAQKRSDGKIIYPASDQESRPPSIISAGKPRRLKIATRSPPRSR